MGKTIRWDPQDALIFTQVIEEGTFTAAARALDLPKSTVSRRVSRLEEQLGVQLLRRTTRRLNLTDAGRAFYSRASQAVEALAAAEDAVTSMLDVPRGRLRVTGPPEPETRMFGAILEFNLAYPDVHVELELTNRYVNLVEEGYDVAIRARAPEGSLTGRPLPKTEMHVVASPDYLERRGTPRRARDVAKHDCILFPSFLTNSAWTLVGPHGEATLPVQGRLTVNNLEGVRKAAVRGCGLALLPAGHCAGDIRAGTLRRVLPGLRMKGGGLWVVYSRTRFMSAKVRAFVDHMHAELG